MSIENGRVVLCLAGRDKGTFAAVVGSTANTVLIADGKHRPLENPKMKNLKHVKVTAYRLNNSDMATDRGLRRALTLLAATDL